MCGAPVRRADADAHLLLNGSDGLHHLRVLLCRAADGHGRVKDRADAHLHAILVTSIAVHWSHVGEDGRSSVMAGELIDLVPVASLHRPHERGAEGDEAGLQLRIRPRDVLREGTTRGGNRVHGLGPAAERHAEGGAGQELLVDGIHDAAVQDQQVRLELDLAHLEVRAQVHRTSCGIEDGSRETAAGTVRVQLQGQLQRELVQVQEVMRVGDGTGRQVEVDDSRLISGDWLRIRTVEGQTASDQGRCGRIRRRLENSELPRVVSPGHGHALIGIVDGCVKMLQHRDKPAVI